MFTPATWLEIISDAGLVVELLLYKKRVALLASGMVVMLPLLSFHK